MEQQNIIETALNAAQKPFVLEKNGQFYLMTPSENGGWQFAIRPEMQTTPLRPKQRVLLHDTKSLIEYVNNHKMPGTQVAIDAEFSNGEIDVEAILDGHHGTTPGWSEWRARFTPQLTTDAQRWIKHNGDKMSQSNFATFLNNQAMTIVSSNPVDQSAIYPSATDVLDFASNLEITKSFKFKKGYREQDGNIQLEFKEENDAGTERRLNAFSKFGISFQPYLNGPSYFVEAALKFRVDNNSGSCVLWYELKNIEKVFEEATKEIANEIETALGKDIPVYYGSF